MARKNKGFDRKRSNGPIGIAKSPQVASPHYRIWKRHFAATFAVLLALVHFDDIAEHTTRSVQDYA